MKKGDVCLIDLTILEALRFPYTLAIFPDNKNNLEQKSLALIFHLRAIDKTRILKTIGKINLKLQKEIDEILKRMLGL